MEEITSRSAPNFPHRNGQSRQLVARDTRRVDPATKRGGFVEWSEEGGDLRQPWGGTGSGAGIRRGMRHMDREEELANELATAHNEARALHEEVQRTGDSLRVASDSLRVASDSNKTLTEEKNKATEQLAKFEHAQREAAEDKKRVAELQQCLKQAAEEKDATVREGMQAEMVRFKKEFEEKAKTAAEHDKLRAMLAEEKLKTSYGHEAMIKELEVFELCAPCCIDLCTIAVSRIKNGRRAFNNWDF